MMGILFQFPCSILFHMFSNLQPNKVMRSSRANSRSGIWKTTVQSGIFWRFRVKSSLALQLFRTETFPKSSVKCVMHSIFLKIEIVQLIWDYLIAYHTIITSFIQGVQLQPNSVSVDSRWMNSFSALSIGLSLEVKIILSFETLLSAR